jgi:hypothetical protein
MKVKLVFKSGGKKVNLGNFSMNVMRLKRAFEEKNTNLIPRVGAGSIGENSKILVEFGITPKNGKKINIEALTQVLTDLNLKSGWQIVR